MSATANDTQHDMQGDPQAAELTADALIEEVSIDGMCGVY